MPGRKPCAVNNRCPPLHLDAAPQRGSLRSSLQTSADYCFPSSGLYLLSWVESVSLMSKGLWSCVVNIYQHGEPCSAGTSIPQLNSCQRPPEIQQGPFISSICLAAAQERLALNKTPVITNQKMPHLTQPAVTNTAIVVFGGWQKGCWRRCFHTCFWVTSLDQYVKKFPFYYTEMPIGMKADTRLAAFKFAILSTIKQALVCERAVSQ